eukprot:TRINITY_DN22804_c0_g1_i1.p1 TRINITY_DN22804_c0_g1~~TRINITY_DN22804_c0_g1_i1.p1  ORF type:complete len:223 (+),score=59.99 TRINITY_DN22804_c0_g1_i1:548-1216(+)
MREKIATEVGRGRECEAVHGHARRAVEERSWFCKRRMVDKVPEKLVDFEKMLGQLMPGEINGEGDGGGALSSHGRMAAPGGMLKQGGTGNEKKEDDTNGSAWCVAAGRLRDDGEQRESERDRCREPAGDGTLSSRGCKAAPGVMVKKSGNGNKKKADALYQKGADRKDEEDNFDTGGKEDNRAGHHGHGIGGRQKVRGDPGEAEGRCVHERQKKRGGLQVRG